MSRGVEARGSVRTLGVPRALGTFRERRKAKFGIRPARGRKEYGRWCAPHGHSGARAARTRNPDV